MKATKAVIPAAGFGTRFLPATKTVPKEMIPLVDRPLIHEVVMEAVRSGIDRLVLVTAAGKSSIEDYFDINPALERFLEEKGKGEILEEVRRISRMVEVLAVRQKEPRGLGHAVLCARDLVGAEPFAVILPDEIMDSEIPCLMQLDALFSRTGQSVIGLQEVPRSETGKYGIIDGDPEQGGAYRVRGVVEKPDPAKAPTRMAVIGRYLLAPEIFPILENLPPGAGGEIQLADALDILARRGELAGQVFQGTRHDAGDKLGFLMATVHYGLKDRRLGPPFLRFLREKISSLGEK
ncbi:MAG: UTP--glucose-1-phosphate uridylyltransferase GalU [Proteobacteria bacterium]|nr:UTP--glucose-1-phosphate uridylyltransferase GalU [Pseudomonadota bacterium]